MNLSEAREGDLRRELAKREEARQQKYRQEQARAREAAREKMLAPLREQFPDVNDDDFYDIYAAYRDFCESWG